MNIDKFALTRQLLATYFFRVGWLIADCWRYFKLRIFGVVLLNWIGVTSAASVFGGFILYVRYLESGRSLTLLGIDIQLETPSMLVLSAIALLCLGIVSSVCLYKTDWLIAHLAIAYQKRAIYRLFQVASDPAYQGWQKLVDGPPNQAMQVFLGTSRSSAIALRSVLGGILPTLTFLLALAFLINTSLILTALLLPLVFIYLVPLYQANHWVMQSQTDYAKLNRPMQKGIAQVLEDVIEAEASQEYKMSRAQATLDTLDYQKVAILFYSRKMINSRLRLVNTIFFTVCIIGVFTFFALNPNYGEYRWSNLLIYLFALQFAFGGLQQITSVMGKMSRLSPIYRYYVDFMSQVEPYRRQRQRSPLLNQPLPDHLVAAFPAIQLPASTRQIEIQPGEPVWVVIPDAPTYSILEAIAARLEDTLIPPADLLSKSAFLSKASLELSQDSRKDLHILEHLLFEDSPLRTYLQTSALGEELKRYDAHMRQGYGAPKSLSDEATYLLAALPLMRAKTIAWISVQPLLKLNPDLVSVLLSSFPQHYLFFVTDDPAKALKRSAMKHQRHPSTQVMVLGNQGIAGCGDVQWLSAHLPTIQAYLKAEQEAASNLYGDIDQETD